MNKRTAKATDDEIKEQVQVYLHGAADRCGGKVERMKRKRLELAARASQHASDSSDCSF